MDVLGGGVAADSNRDPVDVVAQVYEAINRGDPALFSLLDDDIVWVTPSTLPWTLPGSDGTYTGHTSLAGYFQNVLALVDNVRAEVAELVPAGGCVLALGYECGTARETGASFRARFAQLWTTRGGRVVRLDGFPDTAAIQEAFSTSPL